MQHQLPTAIASLAQSDDVIQLEPQRLLLAVLLQKNLSQQQRILQTTMRRDCVSDVTTSMNFVSVRRVTGAREGAGGSQHLRGASGRQAAASQLVRRRDELQRRRRARAQQQRADADAQAEGQAVREESPRRGEAQARGNHIVKLCHIIAC